MPALLRSRLQDPIQARSSRRYQSLRRPRSLHLIERFGEGPLQLKSFLDLVRASVRIFSILQEAGALMFVKELGDSRHVFVPVLRPSFEVYKNRGDASLVEERNRVVDVSVEISVEDALVHE